MRKSQGGSEPKGGLSARVDEICDTFEAAWRAGEEPHIETFLVDAGLVDRHVLLTELLLAEWAFRERSAKSIDLDAYTERFADDAQMIVQLWGERDRSIDILTPTPKETLEAYETHRANPMDGTEGDDSGCISSDPLHGQVVCHFQILDSLGAGGMGKVYLAEDMRLERRVALKLLAPEFTQDVARLRRFEQEARAASALNHPNIVTIHDVGEADVGRFLVMELVSGKTIREIVREPPPWDVVSEIGRQIAEALEVAHAAGIVHRDIKPQNIMVRDDGYVKLLDFGLVRLVSLDGNKVLPRGVLSPQPQNSDSAVLGGSDAIVGTASYMSPEQAQGLEVICASDLFSLGIVLYQLATGRHPFAAESSEGYLSRIVTQAPISPYRLQPDLPRALEELILNLLDKDARQRPAAGDVQRRLAALLTRHPRHVATDGQPARRQTVGREEELAQLRQVFDHAAHGSGGLICVTGEAGIGKTTLVEAFLAELMCSDQPVVVGRGRCSERLAGAEAYLPILEMLEDLLRGETANYATRVMKTVAPAWYCQIASDVDDSTPVTQERLKRELATLLEEISRDRPLVLFLDDVHWADVSTVDLLAYVGFRCDSLRLLLLLTYRPHELLQSRHAFVGAKQELEGRAVCREIPLKLLSGPDIERYLALQFPEHEFPPQFLALLDNRTEGNPLFLVDLLRYLRDRSVIVQEDGRWVLKQPVQEIELAIPQSVVSMIQRKIDQLSEEDRHLLVAASVQGFEFDVAVVAKALALDVADAEERFDVLDQVHGFVRFVHEQEFPDRTLTAHYCFVHVLYQNSLYASLRPTRRALLSAAMAQALQGCYGERSTDVASKLAMLLETAREFERASKYFRLASEQAAGLCAFDETVALARRGLRVLDDVPETPRRAELELGLRTVLGPALMATASWSAPEVKSNYARSRELCEQAGESPQLFPTVHGMFSFSIAHAEIPAALDLADELFRLARASQEPAFLLQAHHALANVGWPAGEFELGQRNAKSGTALYDAEEHHSHAILYMGCDPGVMCLFHASPSLWALGFPDQALKSAQEAAILAHTLSHSHSLVAAYTMEAMVHQRRGEVNLVREQSQAAITLCAELDYTSPFMPWASVYRGWALAVQGLAKDGVAQLLQGMADWQTVGVEVLRPYFLMLLADANLRHGHVEDGLEALDEALGLIEKTREGFAEADVHRLRGELILMDRSDDEPAAEACFRKALEVARRQKAKSYELRAVISLSRLLSKQGRREEARSMLAEVYSWFTEGFDTRDLKEAMSLVKITAG